MRPRGKFDNNKAHYLFDQNSISLNSHAPKHSNEMGCQKEWCEPSITSYAPHFSKVIFHQPSGWNTFTWQPIFSTSAHPLPSTMKFHYPKYSGKILTFTFGSLDAYVIYILPLLTNLLLVRHYVCFSGINPINKATGVSTFPLVKSSSHIISLPIHDP